jgi:hypothetical protein
MFWVGLMDGKGSIQVNHWHMKSLQYRLIIKLSNFQDNHTMLLKIAKIIGGTVRIVNNKKEVIWVVEKKENIINIINIFTLYPPLTSRLICQLEFMKVCLKDNSIQNYLINRNLKYSNQQNIIKEFNIKEVIPTYFPSWLSGFIEAEGSFSIKINNKNSFSISLNNDYYLLQAIKLFFNSSVKVKNPYSKFYILETYKRETLNTIINHCINYPLLGDKSQALDRFIKVFVLHKL